MRRFVCGLSVCVICALSAPLLAQPLFTEGTDDGMQARASEPLRAPPTTSAPANLTLAQHSGQTIDVFSLSISGARLHMSADEVLEAIRANFPNASPVVRRSNSHVSLIGIISQPFVFEVFFERRIEIPGLRPGRGQEVARWIELAYSSNVPRDVERQFFEAARQRYGEPTRRGSRNPTHPDIQFGSWFYCNPCGQSNASAFPIDGDLPYLQVQPQEVNRGPRIRLVDRSYQKRVENFLRQQHEQGQRNTRPPL